MPTLVQQALERFSRASGVEDVLARVARGDRAVAASHVRGGAGAALAALLAARDPMPLVILTSNLERAEALADGIGFFGATPLIYPPLETLPYETTEPGLHIASQRLRALHSLAEWRPGRPTPVVLAPADALMHRIPSAQAIRELCIVINWGEPVDIDGLAAKLVGMGYRREGMVESPGEFSIRGTIVDIYPADAERPWRLDFFGEEIESIRSFDTATQRSIPLPHEVERIEILPRAALAPALDLLASGGTLATFFDLLPEGTRFIIEGPSRVAQRIDYFDEIAKRHWHEVVAHPNAEEPNYLLEHGIAPEGWTLTPAEAREGLARHARMDWIDLAAEADELPAASRMEPIQIGSQSFENLSTDYKAYIDLLEEKRLAGFWTAIICDNLGQVSRLEELLSERHVGAVRIGPDGQPEGTLSANDVALMVGDLHEGFIIASAQMLLITDREIFGRYKRRRTYRKASTGKSVKDPTEIQRGDFIVHADHGIGRFERVRRQPIEGLLCEFLEITYQDGDKLLVPIEKLHLVQKYASAEGKEPALDKLGKKTWGRRRAKTKEAVKKMAGELLELYARREAAARPPYGADTVWQQEFEASFLYQETPDQLKAIHEVKSDMAQTRPMDRLVCGDVGYGKTEVAIRAAFKALADGRQVAVLVPTTLLAVQHYNTFRERLADFPFKTAVMSRFQSAAEQKEILKEIASGETRLVVGTHRLLSKDIKFKELGLLVVDEEQRFGVAQKEKIKNLRTAVDILTLTATPIPRTLHMALAKLRDLSLIQTPPADRLPIKTRTIHFEKEALEEAILRELNRGGQIFFIHNRIENIEEVADSIREIVPKARIVSAHGRMDEDDLEKIMSEFIAGKHDILISTTIIENGIDIPNVNTIIINRADMFGLAQLYQIRGRVGRDVRQAYAYLIMPRGRAMTDQAVKRLAALEEFTELGMGFSIAMRDMEIRGTGNILGGEQHGAISDVGFELYCKLLEEAVDEIRGELPAEPAYATEVKWPVDQWLPEVYVPIEAQRIRLYKDLASARSFEELDQVRDELLDRYGEIPPEGKNLINAFRIKIALAPWRVDMVRPGVKGTARIICKDFAQRLADELAGLAKVSSAFGRVDRRADGTIMLYFNGADEDEQPDLDLKELADLVAGVPPPPF